MTDRHKSCSNSYTMPHLVPFHVGSLPVLEDDASCDLLSHPISGDLVEAEAIAMALLGGRKRKQERKRAGEGISTLVHTLHLW